MTVKIIFLYKGPVFVNDRLGIPKLIQKIEAKDRKEAEKKLRNHLIKKNKLPKFSRLYFPGNFSEIERSF